MIHIAARKRRRLIANFISCKNHQKHITAPIGAAANGRSDENNRPERRRGDGAVAVRGNDEYVHRHR